LLDLMRRVSGVLFRPMSRKGRVFAFLTSVLVISFVMLVWYLEHTESAMFRFFRLAELGSLDVRFLIRGKIPTTDKVVIVALDEETIKKAGTFPIPRGMFGKLVERLTDAGAAVIAFDALFAEPQNLNELTQLDGLIRTWRERVAKNPDARSLLQELIARRNSMDEDAKLARAMERAMERGTWVICAMDLIGEKEAAKGYVGSKLTAEDLNLLATYTYPQKTPRDPERRKELLKVYPPEEAVAVLMVTKKIADKAAGLAFVDYTPDADGVLRLETLTIRYRGNFYIPLSVMAVWYYKQLEPSQVWLRLTEGVTLGDIDIPCDSRNRLLINYRGPSGTFPTYSLCRVVDGEVEPERFRGKIVFVGATAQGAGDFIVTPFSARLPGVEKHATVTDNILKGDFIRKDYLISLLDLICVIGLGVLIGLLLPLFSPVPAILFTLLLWGGWVALLQYLFVRKGIWMNAVYPSLTIFAGFALISVYRFAVEERGKRHIRRLFERYMDVAVVDQMLKSSEEIKLGGDTMEVTVFFSDVSGFTRISERLSSAELIELLNRYFPPLTDVILSHGGFVNKYQGDAIVAAFGVPVKQDDHARRACLAALECQRRLRLLNKELTESGMPPMPTRIGLSSGPAVVGNIGSARRAEYTVIGDAINLGQRLEAANKPLGTSILISSVTYRLAKDGIAVRDVGLIQVRGREEPVRVYELIDKTEAVSDDLRVFVRRFEEALQLFAQRKWDDAETILKELLKVKPDDGPTRFYLEQIQAMRANPPDSHWDGSVAIMEK